jgi:hypothetical protein
VGRGRNPRAEAMRATAALRREMFDAMAHGGGDAVLALMREMQATVRAERVRRATERAQ